MSKRALRPIDHHQRCSVKKVVLKISQNSQENTCARVIFLVKLQVLAYNFIKEETMAQVFSCESCKIYKNTFSYRTPPVATSDNFSVNKFLFSVSSFSVYVFFLLQNRYKEFEIM